MTRAEIPGELRRPEESDQRSPGSADRRLDMAVEGASDWADPERLQLLLLWRQRPVQQELRAQVQVRYVWQRLAEQLLSRGYRRSAEQCRNEVCRLVESYRRAVRSRLPADRFFGLLHGVLSAPPSRPQAADPPRSHSRRRRPTPPSTGGAARPPAPARAWPRKPRNGTPEYDDERRTRHQRSQLAENGPADRESVPSCGATPGQTRDDQRGSGGPTKHAGLAVQYGTETNLQRPRSDATGRCALTDKRPAAGGSGPAAPCPSQEPSRAADRPPAAACDGWSARGPDAVCAPRGQPPPPRRLSFEERIAEEVAARCRMEAAARFRRSLQRSAIATKQKSKPRSRSQGKEGAAKQLKCASASASPRSSGKTKTVTRPEKCNKSKADIKETPLTDEPLTINNDDLLPERKEENSGDEAMSPPKYLLPSKEAGIPSLKFGKEDQNRTVALLNTRPPASGNTDRSIKTCGDTESAKPAAPPTDKSLPADLGAEVELLIEKASSEKKPPPMPDQPSSYDKDATEHGESKVEGSPLPGDSREDSLEDSPDGELLIASPAPNDLMQSPEVPPEGPHPDERNTILDRSSRDDSRIREAASSETTSISHEDPVVDQFKSSGVRDTQSTNPIPSVLITQAVADASAEKVEQSEPKLDENCTESASAGGPTPTSGYSGIRSRERAHRKSGDEFELKQLTSLSPEVLSSVEEVPKTIQLGISSPTSPKPAKRLRRPPPALLSLSMLRHSRYPATPAAPYGNSKLPSDDYSPTLETAAAASPAVPKDKCPVPEVEFMPSVTSEPATLLYPVKDTETSPLALFGRNSPGTRFRANPEPGSFDVKAKSSKLKRMKLQEQEFKMKRQEVDGSSDKVPSDLSEKCSKSGLLLSSSLETKSLCSSEYKEELAQNGLHRQTGKTKPHSRPEKVSEPKQVLPARSSENSSQRLLQHNPKLNTASVSGRLFWSEPFGYANNVAEPAATNFAASEVKSPPVTSTERNSDERLGSLLQHSANYNLQTCHELSPHPSALDLSRAASEVLISGQRPEVMSRDVPRVGPECTPVTRFFAEPRTTPLFSAPISPSYSSGSQDTGWPVEFGSRCPLLEDGSGTATVKRRPIRPVPLLAGRPTVSLWLPPAAAGARWPPTAPLRPAADGGPWRTTIVGADRPVVPVGLAARNISRAAPRDSLLPPLPADTLRPTPLYRRPRSSPAYATRLLGIPQEMQRSAPSAEDDLFTAHTPRALAGPAAGGW